MTEPRDPLPFLALVGAAGGFAKDGEPRRAVAALPPGSPALALPSGPLPGAFTVPEFRAPAFEAPEFRAPEFQPPEFGPKGS